MSPQLALLLCVGFILWLFRSDIKLRRLPSLDLWIPGIWLAIIGSRPLGYWLGGGGGVDDTAVEGNPINQIVQGGLMLASLVILHRRAFDWGGFLRANKALIGIYLFFALSALWSYYPFASAKRICRDFGSVLMVLVILSEGDPLAAATLLFVRISYLLFPLSILFIKYYPNIGRMHSRGWETLYSGVTTHKNTLGMVVMVFGLMIVLDILELRRQGDPSVRKTSLRIRFGMLLMGAWLLVKCDSKTSLLCILIGLCVLCGGQYVLRMQSPGRAIAACLAAALCFGALDWIFDISGTVFTALGRNETLTGRTEVWQMVMEQPINPIIGCGFLSFWDSPLVLAYNENTAIPYNESHNGYLDAYADGGALALLLLAILLLVASKKTMEELFTGSLFGRASFMFFVIALVYNWSESSFFRLNGPLWFTLLLAIVKRPPRRTVLKKVDDRQESNEVIVGVAEMV